MPTETKKATMEQEPVDLLESNDAMLAKSPLPRKSIMPTVSVMLPVPPESETGVNRVMVETITLNGVKKTLPRGEMIELSVAEYMLLRNKFDHI